MTQAFGQGIPKGYTECKWEAIYMKDLKAIKQTVISYGCYS